jgi:hypothetical protein
MERPALSLVILTCCLYLSGRATAQEGQRYSSSPGRFSITFPGPVEESVDTTRTDAGTIMDVHLITYAPSDEVVYMTSWVDMTDLLGEDAAMKGLLERSRDGSTTAMEATSVNTTALDTSGTRPFIEFTFAATDLVGKERIYMVDKFQYALITLFPTSTGIPPEADTFFASFKAGGRPPK